MSNAAAAATEAAAPAAEAGAADKPALPKVSGKSKLMILVAAIAAIALLKTGFLFVLVALLPAIVTHYFDRSKHRYMFKTIGRCNLAGLIPFVAMLLHGGSNSGKLEQVMGDPSTWIIIYGAACIGWLMIMAMPMIAQIFIGQMHSTQVQRLARAQKKIESEWGDEIRQFSENIH